MRAHILIATVLMLSTSAWADETRGLIQPASSAEAPVILSAEQLAAQQVQQAAVQPAPPPPTAQQTINATHVPQAAQQGAPQQSQQVKPTPEQQAAQQQAMRQQQMEQQRRMQQQKMQQQRMMQERMARNMTPEQKLAYKVHEVRTKVRTKLVQVLFR